MVAKHGAPGRKTDPIRCSNGVKIVASEVSLTKTCPYGWAVKFKKNPASVRNV